MVAIAGFNKDQILLAVRNMYTEVATLPSNFIFRLDAMLACSSATQSNGSINCPLKRWNHSPELGFHFGPMSFTRETVSSILAAVREPIP